MKELSIAARNIPLSPIREMFDMAMGMKDVVSFTLGEPDFQTPPHIVEAAVEALRSGKHHYTPNAGILPLTFADPADYDSLTQGSKLTFVNLKDSMKTGVFTMVDESTGKEITLKGEFTQRQQQIIMCGGLLNYTKENS